MILQGAELPGAWSPACAPGGDGKSVHSDQTLVPRCSVPPPCLGSASGACGSWRKPSRWEMCTGSVRPSRCQDWGFHDGLPELVPRRWGVNRVGHLASTCVLVASASGQGPQD